MKRSYPTKPNITPYTQEDIYSMSSLPLSWFKSISDKYACQFDITIKPDGVKINVIKKSSTTKVVRKRSIELDNTDLKHIKREVTEVLGEMLMLSASDNYKMSIPMVY